jgi:hypothetical protein
MSDAILAGYLIIALLAAWPVWHASDQYERWVRVTLMVAGPFMLFGMLLRRVFSGRW